MALTMERLVNEYQNKPDPAGRGFWYDAEIAQREGISNVQEVTRLRGFYQTELNKPGATQASVIALWNAKGAAVPSTPLAQPSGQEPTLGSLKLSVAEAWFRKIGVIK